jgi:hypothetical protein
MSSEEEIKNIKVKLVNAADSIRDFMLQLGKLRQDLISLSSKLEELTIAPEPEKEKTKISGPPPPPIPKPPPVSTPKPVEVTSLPKMAEAAPKEALKEEQKVPEKVIATPPAKQATAAPVQKPVQATAAPKSTIDQPKTEQLKQVSDLGTSAIPLNKVVGLLNELEQLCEGSLPAEEVASKIETTKKSLQSLILYHPVYYEMDKTIKNFRTTSPKQPLSPTDKAMLLSKIPEWKRRMM